MDELIGDPFTEKRVPRPQGAERFAPRVDVYYCGGPGEEGEEGAISGPRVVVKAELAGVDIDTVTLEVSGRQLVISGERPVAETEGRVYQQVEIEAGPFRRVVELAADVDSESAHASYEDGILRVELPLATQVTPPRPDRVSSMAESTIEVVETGDVEQALRDRAEQPLPAALPVLPLREIVAYPDTLTPLAVGQERSIKLVDDVLSGDRMLVLVASRDPEVDEPGPEQLYDVGVVGVVARMLKVPDGTIRILVQATERVRIGELRDRAALPGRPDRVDARPRSSPRPSSRR